MKSLSNANLFDEYLYNEPFTSTGNHDYKIALIFIHENVWIKNGRHTILRRSKKLEFISYNIKVQLQGAKDDI